MMKRTNPNEENRRRWLSQTLAALPRGARILDWPLAYVVGLSGLMYGWLRGRGRGSDLACLGRHCLAVRLP